MTLSSTDFMAFVAEANLAPSVHNTQPTRWRREPDGTITVWEDNTRRLPVGDPEGRDAAVSHGAAIEGFSLAAAAKGLVVTVALPPEKMAAQPTPVASLSLTPGACPDPLHAFIARRRTYRGAFAATDLPVAIDILGVQGDVHLVSDRQGLAHLARLNDVASLRAYRNGAYRAELLSWMRLSRRDHRWSLDGLNAEAMAMSPLEAAGAGFVLKPAIFETLDRIGFARPLVAEAKVVRSASAVVLFHRPEAEPAIITGRRFYRIWLEMESLGLSAAPMAVLADDLYTSEIIRQEFGIPSERRLITTFRLGVPPHHTTQAKPRLPTPSLIV